LSKPAADRRVHPRISTNLDLQVTPEDGGVVARVVANNVSLGGLYCTSNADFPEMTRLAVRLLLPPKPDAADEANPLDLEAVVVRREELGPSAAGEARVRLGLFFTNVDDSARDQISRFLDSKHVRVN